MNKIDLLVKLFKAEKRVDLAIASRLSRISEDRQLQFTLGGKNG